MRQLSLPAVAGIHTSVACRSTHCDSSDACIVGVEVTCTVTCGLVAPSESRAFTLMVLMPGNSGTYSKPNHPPESLVCVNNVPLMSAVTWILGTVIPPTWVVTLCVVELLNGLSRVSASVGSACSSKCTVRSLDPLLLVA